jgi:hypothetical protein
MIPFRKYYLFFFAAILLLPLACKKENSCDCFKSTGDIVTENRAPGLVNRIFLEDNINLIMTSGNAVQLSVEAGENLLPLIKTEISGNEIHIRNENKCNWVRSYKHKPTVYLTLPMVDYIEYSGSGDITMTNTFTGDTIAVNSWNGSGTININLNYNASHLNVHTGPADINVTGTVSHSYVWYAGNGMVHAENFTSYYTYITNKGTGNCYLNITNELYANISWTGCIYYSGNPQIVVPNISGKGTLIKQ